MKELKQNGLTYTITRISEMQDNATGAKVYAKISNGSRYYSIKFVLPYSVYSEKELITEKAFAFLTTAQTFEQVKALYSKANETFRQYRQNSIERDTAAIIEWRNFHVEMTNGTQLFYGGYGWRNYWYKFNVKIYNSDRTRLYKRMFVVMFDDDDLYDAYGDERITKQRIKEYAQELAAGFIELIKDYNDISEFTAACNESIQEYNRIAA